MRARVCVRVLSVCVLAPIKVFAEVNTHALVCFIDTCCAGVHRAGSAAQDGAELLLKVDAKTQEFLKTYEEQRRTHQQVGEQRR